MTEAVGGIAASIPSGKYTPSLPAGHERAPTLVIVMDAHANPLRVRGIILDENESAHDDQHQELYLSTYRHGFQLQHVPIIVVRTPNV